MNYKKFKTYILIPTLNAGNKWVSVLNSIEAQSFKVTGKIIIDSGSNDETVDIAKKYGFNTLNIIRQDFDHGYARQLMADNALDADILIYLTQDCILADKSSIKNLLTAFDNEQVAIAYGRQLPHVGAKILESHSRYFNYPALSKIKSLDDRDKLGIKTASCSNSFAAYRKSLLLKSGGFPLNSIFGEDVIVGGRLLLAGWKIAYVAEATVYHSHDYTVVEEFKRFFDIGVFHHNSRWLLNEFGKADGEGLKYVKSELKVVFKHNILLLPKVFFSIFSKFLGYKLGLHHEALPTKIKKIFSMHTNYWDKIKISNP